MRKLLPTLLVALGLFLALSMASFPVTAKNDDPTSTPRPTNTPRPDPTSTDVCHFNEGHGGDWNLITVSINSVADAQGVHGHGDHENDAWLSYTYDGVSYPGKNEAFVRAGCVEPTATPVTPTATPITPTATPVTPTATPVTPTATPVTPMETPVTPTETPITPTLEPTATLVPTDTNTPEPTATLLPTATREPKCEAKVEVVYPMEFWSSVDAIPHYWRGPMPIAGCAVIKPEGTNANALRVAQICSLCKTQTGDGKGYLFVGSYVLYDDYLYKVTDCKGNVSYWFAGFEWKKEWVRSGFNQDGTRVCSRQNGCVDEIDAQYFAYLKQQ